MTSILKRKRSESELSFVSNTTYASPSRPAPSFDFPIVATETNVNSDFMHRENSAPLHLPSRTFKRFRNSRPSDAEVYEHTLNLMYTAQQSIGRQSPFSEQPFHKNREESQQDYLLSSRPSVDDNHCIRASDQLSLHSFWKLPKPVSFQPRTSPATAEVSKLDDCDIRMTRIYAD